MANTYNWVISQLDCYPEQSGKSNVVFTIHWRREAINGAYQASSYGSQTVTLDPAAPFTPYSQLTQAQVERWLIDAMSVTSVAEMDVGLAAQIDAQMNPSVIAPPLPWGN